MNGANADGARVDPKLRVYRRFMNLLVIINYYSKMLKQKAKPVMA